MILNYKKCTFLTAISLLIFFNGKAQDVEKIKLEVDGQLMSTQPLENGVAFVTNDKKEIQITNYSNNFSKEWSVSLGQEYKEMYHPKYQSVNDALPTPSGKYIYSVQIHYNGYHRKTHYISKIDLEGNITKYEIEGRDELGKELQTIFCNDDNLYYLATENGDQNHDRKKSKEKLILNSFSNEDFSYSRKILDLPSVEGEEEIFWEFIGHNSSEFFIASKKVNSDENISEVNIISFDNAGNLQNSFTLNVELENGFIRPARLVKSNNRIFSDQENLDYTVNPQSNSIYPTYGGFTGIHFEGGHIYLYGLLGPGKFKKVAAKYEGAYVIKFDLKGNQIWKKELTDNVDLINNKHFNKHATPGLRGISLAVLPDETVNFNINVAERLSTSLYKYIISPEGLNTKVENVDNIRESAGFTLALYYDDNKNHGKQFIRTTDIGQDKGTIFGNLFYKNLEVLYELNIRDREIKNIYLLK